MPEAGTAARIDKGLKGRRVPERRGGRCQCLSGGNHGLEQLATASLEAGERAGLIARHEPRVADLIRDQDRDKPALRAGNGR